VVDGVYPGPVLHGCPVAEPSHLGPGWVGFDYRAAFARPVKVVNDAAMQALGRYRGGGNVHQLEALPPGCRAGDNANAFVGGELLWKRPLIKRRAARASTTIEARPAKA
jgi:hypothetical protein